MNFLYIFTMEYFVMKYDTQTAFMQSLRLNVKWKRWEFHDNKELVPFLKTPQTKYVYQFYVYTYI